MKVRIKSSGLCHQTSVTTEAGDNIPCRAITIHPMHVNDGLIKASIELSGVSVDLVVDADRILWNDCWWKKEENVA